MEPFNFHTYWQLNVPAEAVNFQIESHGKTYNVPEAQEKAYYFNRNGRDEWGLLHIRPVYICPADSSEKAFEPATIELEVLDYGLYFLAADGSSQKYLPPAADPDGNPLFDPTKPTVIYVHGWQPFTVKDHKREYLSDKAGGSYARLWKEAGWNVAIFYWNQFSDEQFVQLAEGKIHHYQENASGTGLTWRKEKDNVLTPATADAASPQYSATALFAQEYSRFIAQSQSGKVRLVGHSLGGQFVNTVSPMIPKANRPARIALLDPFFSATYTQLFNQNITYLKANGSILEWYETSILTDLGQFFSNIMLNATSPEDEYNSIFQKYFDALANRGQYPETKEKAAFMKLDLAYAGLDPSDRHHAAVPHYFSSIADSPQGPQVGFLPTLAEVLNQAAAVTVEGHLYRPAGYGAINAATCNERVRQLMQYKSHLSQIGGLQTLTTNDDVLLWEYDTEPEGFNQSLACAVDMKFFDGRSERDDPADDYFSVGGDFLVGLARANLDSATTTQQLDVSSKDLLIATRLDARGRPLAPAARQTLTLDDDVWQPIYITAANEADYAFNEAGVFTGSISIKVAGTDQVLSTERVSLIQEEDEVLYRMLAANNPYPHVYEQALAGTGWPAGWVAPRTDANIWFYPDMRDRNIPSAFTSWISGNFLRDDYINNVFRYPDLNQQRVMLKKRVPRNQYMRTNHNYGDGVEILPLQVAEIYAEYIIIGPVHNCHTMILEPGENYQLNND